VQHTSSGTTENMTLHDRRMTPNFNYTLERSLGGDSCLHATETRPRVCEPSGKARLRSTVNGTHHVTVPNHKPL
jgi:hypothetical protein